MSISYSPRDLMFYELNWNVSNEGILLSATMTNELQIPWNIEFTGKHKKLIKSINSKNQELYYGKLCYNEKLKTISYVIISPIFSYFIKPAV